MMYRQVPGIISSYASTDSSGFLVQIDSTQMRFVLVDITKQGLLKLHMINFDRYLNMDK